MTGELVVYHMVPRFADLEAYERYLDGALLVGTQSSQFGIDAGPLLVAPISSSLNELLFGGTMPPTAKFIVRVVARPQPGTAPEARSLVLQLAEAQANRGLAVSVVVQRAGPEPFSTFVTNRTHASLAEVEQTWQESPTDDKIPGLVVALGGVLDGPSTVELLRVVIPYAG